MSLFTDWSDLAEKNGHSQEFWTQYFSTEQGIYDAILTSKETKISGTVQSFADTHEIQPIVALGFFDGINTSLEEELDLESLTEESELNAEINWEKLFYNMLVAKADWLYNLESWDDLLTMERRLEIKKEYNKDMTFINDEPKVGRNEPCPCGSGKKYKKCCLK